jgi:dCMP deaminase
MHDLDYLRAAYLAAKQYSDDPDTQNGAVLVSLDPEKPAIEGANGFPLGMVGTPERLQRPAKYLYIEHAERGVIYEAAALGIPTSGATLYCPWFACVDCARAIIQAGIRRVVGHQDMLDKTPDRWQESIAQANAMLDEAKVAREYVHGKLFDDENFIVLFDGKPWSP